MTARFWRITRLRLSRVRAAWSVTIAPGKSPCPIWSEAIEASADINWAFALGLEGSLRRFSRRRDSISRDSAGRVDGDAVLLPAFADGLPTTSPKAHFLGLGTSTS